MKTDGTAANRIAGGERIAKAFSLKPETGSAGVSDRVVSCAVDAFFLSVFLIGLSGWMIRGLNLNISLISAVFIDVLIACALVFVYNINGKIGRLVKLGAIGAAAFFAVLSATVFRTGLHAVQNAFVDAVGRRFPYMFSFYSEPGSDAFRAAALYFVFLTVTLAAGLLGIYMVKKGNRLLLGVFIALLALLYAAAGIGPSGFWLALSLMSLLFLWLRGHAEKTSERRQRLALAESAVLTGCAAAALALIGSLMFAGKAAGPDSLTGKISGLKEAAVSRLTDHRYEGGSENLPGGDFRGLGSFESDDTPVFTVTMSDPQSYYLRGFTGGAYNGTGWEDPETEELWNGRDLFYWLHQDGFYAQEALADAAVSLGQTPEAENTNTVKIENTGASSRYCLVPYEYTGSRSEEGRELLDAQKIGDSGIVTRGFHGERTYEYTALASQITNYPRFTAALADEASLTDEGLAFRDDEGYYNEFVYKNYTALPEIMNSVCQDLLGDKNIPDGEKHTDYAEAKQNILFVLTEDYLYDEEMSSPWDGTDFVYDFLTFSKTGYSVHFASAAALMFRYYGIPARYVEGYLITPADRDAMKADEPYTVDRTHAHAWVEYYQDGVGWLPFEITPSYLDVMSQSETYQDISSLVPPQTENPPVEEPEEDEEDEEEDEEEKFDWILLIEILLVIAISLFLLTLIGFLVWVIWKRKKTREYQQAIAGADNNAAIQALFEYAMNILSVTGLKIKNVSLFKYEKPLRKVFGDDLAEDYAASAAIRQEAVYSDHVMSDEARQVVSDFREDVWNRVYSMGGFVERFQLKYIYFL